MPIGLPGFPRTQAYPDQKPPTLLHPASPILQSAKMTNSSENTKSANYGTMTEKDTDNASLASTKTFSSTVSLLKKKLTPKHKEQKPKKVKKVRDPNEWNARARTAEAYYYQATMK